MSIRSLAFGALLWPALAPVAWADAGDDDVLVLDLADGSSLSDAAARLGLPGLAWLDPRTADEALAVVRLAGPAAVVRAAARLQGVDGVEAAEPMIQYEALAVPNDPLYPRQWNMRMVDAPAAWRSGGGAGVRVAVIDTGLTAVPDLAGTIRLPGASFVPGSPSAADGNGHGTHVAGTIAQTTHNALGVVGLSPAVELLSIKVLSDQGFGQSAWIAAGIDEAVDQGAQVINLSLGGPPSDVVRIAAHKAVAQGVIVVAAAGNTGRPGVGSPASVPGVLAVSALGPQAQLAPYSTTGPEVFLAAPGGDKRQEEGGVLQQTVVGEGSDFLALQGTSMAAPHVAAAAAALLSFGAGDAEGVVDALMAGARPLSAGGHDPRFGWGGLDVGASLRGVALGRHLPRGLLAGALTLLALRGSGTRRRAWTAALAAALVGGIGAVLVALPVPGPAVGPLLSRPPLLWAPIFGVGRWLSLIWASGAAAAAATFFLGPHRRLGPLVAGACVGWALHLTDGAWRGGVPLPALSPSLAALWLGANALVAWLCAAAGLGVARLAAREAA